MGRRTHFRMARSLSQAGKGFRSDNRQRRCLGVRRPHPNPHPATRKSLRSNAIFMSRTLKNIDRPVRVYSVNRGEPKSAQASEATTNHGVFDDKPPPLPNKPSIAVLPFQNMSGDPEQEYFADGMVEEIITALSRFKSLFV